MKKTLMVGVITPYGDNVEDFENAYFEPENGHLTVLRDGERIAVFHSGQWRYARYYEPKPVVVPEGTEVVGYVAP